MGAIRQNIFHLIEEQQMLKNKKQKYLVAKDMPNECKNILPQQQPLIGNPKIYTKY